MRRRIARDAQRLPFVEARLVLAVKGGATACLFQDRQHAGVVGDEQASGRGAHEHLDSRRAGQPLELGNVGDIVVRAADPEGEVAMHAPPGAAHLVGERARRGRGRIGVGHFEHGGHAAEDSGARTALEVLLVDGARLAKMHLAVDHAGQDMEPFAVDPPAGRGRAQASDLGDAAAAHADVAQAHAIVVDNGSIHKNEIEGLRHGFSLREAESGLI